MHDLFNESKVNIFLQLVVSSPLPLFVKYAMCKLYEQKRIRVSRKRNIDIYGLFVICEREMIISSSALYIY